MESNKDIQAIYYLSPLQQGLLFHAVSERGEDPYFIQAGFALEGRLDPVAFERAWQAVVERHPVLRTAFVWEGVEKPVQAVRRRVPVTVERRDLRRLDEPARERALAEFLAADRRAGFDLHRPPLMRLALLQVADDAWWFVHSHHHIVLDGWSFALVLREAAMTYEALRAGIVPELARPRPYRDYVAWVQSRDEATAEAYFRRALSGFRAATPVPLEAAPGAGAAAATPPSGDGSDEPLPFAEQACALSRRETEALEARARSLRVTLNTLVQGAWALLLARHSGAPEVVFGATVSGRSPELPGSDAIVGLLINTLPVRVETPRHETLASWLARLQGQNAELRQYEWAPLGRIQRWSDMPGGSSLFDTIVVFDSYPEEQVRGGGELRIVPRLRPWPREGAAVLTTGRNNYALSLIVEPTRELRLIASYQRARLTHDAAARLLAELRALLDAMTAARPELPLAELLRVDAAERRRLVVDFNATTAAPADDATVHGLIEAEAHRRPGTLAVVADDTRLTYDALDRRANQLARRLRALGVGPEDRVALCVERSAELIVGLVGVLKAGAAYVPLDPAYPRERLAAIIADSAARVVVTQSRWAPALAGAGRALVCLDADDALAREDQAPLGLRVAPGQIAYLIYTSGSTGKPKGVAVEHRQLVSYVRGVLARLPLPVDASFGFVSTVSADLGHTALFGALCSGRTLRVLSNECAFDPDAMAEAMAGAITGRVDALKIVPSHLSALLEAAHPERVLPSRCLVLGGEALTAGLVERIRALAPDCAVINHYGPTETTVGALVWEVAAAAPGAAIPIGRPLPGVRAYVLDRHLEPVPVGAPGELYIGGAGVARGYRDRPGLTAERFLPSPFAASPGERLYRTGDRARYRADGAIEFLGRTDHQIKLRGFRIELGEIEAHLRALPEVRDAVVVVRELDGARRLVAYAVAREIASADAAALRERLAQRLPEVMVPSAIVLLPALPLTPNGKIDRAALPEPARVAAPPAEHAAPRNDVEATLARVWAEVLGLPRVGIHDNFFTIGGDSIRSLQAIARANQHGIRLRPKQLFEHPTVAAAAAVAVVTRQATPDRATDAAAAFPLSGLSPEALARVLPDRAGIDDVYPLSPMQEGMLFHTLLNPGSGIYLMQQHYAWNGSLDTALLVEAFRRVAARHPILRTSFLWKDLERPLQIVARDIDLSEVIEVLDLRELSSAEQEARAREILEAELATGFDLTRAPLMRIRVLRVADEAYRIVRSFHHILTDDWCFSVLMMECLSHYAALREGRALELPAPRPYRDYIAWLARQDLGAAERFWREELRGFAAPTALGVERGAAESAELPEGIADEHMTLGADSSRALSSLAQEHGLTLNTFVQGAWALLLERYGAGRDVVFGVTVAGRPTDLPGVETIIGLFINSLPLRVRIHPEATVLSWLSELLAHNYRLREYEYPPLVEIQRWSEIPKGEALFKSLVVFENAPVDPRLGEQVGDVGLAFEHDRVHTNYPLTVVAYPAHELGIRLSYDPRRLEPAAVRGMLRHFIHLIEQMVQRPHARLADLSLISERERRELLGHRAEAVSPPAPTYVSIFEAQVERSPAAEAVTCGARSLTYANLNRAANQIAHALRAEGVAADSIVAVAESRDIELLVGALGVLKAGAAYLPLDPEHPERRLARVLSTSRAPVVLTSERWASRLAQVASHVPPSQRPRLVIREQALARTWSRDNPRAISARGSGPGSGPGSGFGAGPCAGPGHLAYVIFTSGSTGAPKGAMVEHAAMLNNVWGKLPTLGLRSSDVVGQTASQCFDISVWQLLSALLAGGRVHIIPDEVVADPPRLVAEVEQRGVTVLELVPSLLRELVEAPASAAGGLARLRWMLPTGEAILPDLCRRWFERYPAVPLVNAYGPAECADDVALHVMKEPPGPGVARVPIGRAVPNVALHVIAGDDLAPVGVTGELCVGGIAVGRGYLNDPSRTAAAFVPDPFSTVPGARLYRTGDRVRRLADGTLDFVGRSDHQVKIRGFRIEIGEIEACLAEHAGVREAVVVVRDEPALGRRLVAYVAAAASELTPDALGAFLEDRLPGYMVPSAFVVLDALPRNTSGKVDRQALPAPAAAAPAPGLPRTPTEDLVVGIWAEVLGLDRVPTQTSFFELGGHSLLATQVTSRVRKALGVELPLRSVFDHPTVAELARDIDQRRTGGPAAPPIVALPRSGPAPLSFAQQRMWFLAELEPDSAEYNMTAAVRMSGAVDLAVLEHSFAALADRHETLRTTFHAVAGEPVQVIAATGAPAFEVVDLSGTPEAAQAQAVQRLASARAGRPFDLARGPLARVAVIRLAPDEHVLVLVVHHIVADGWSMNLLVSELAELYEAARAGRRPALRPLAIQYADFAAWQRGWMQGAVRDDLLAYWRKRLSNAPPALELAADRERAVDRHLRPSYRGARHVSTVGRELTEALRALGRREGATLFMTLLAAFKALLFSRTGRTDLLVGTDVAGRDRHETEGLIGFFVNLLVLRTDLGGAPTFRALLERVRRSALDAYAHQDLPFEQVVDAVRPPREPGRHPLVQTLFVLQNMPGTEIQLTDLRLRGEDLDWEVSRFDLGVFVEDTADGLLVTWKHRTDLFEPATIEAIAGELEAVLRSVADNPDERITALAGKARSARRTPGDRAGRLRSLRGLAPRRVGDDPATLISTRQLGAELMPLVCEPAVADVQLAAWVRDARPLLEAQLHRHGALLFRGFGVRTIVDFEAVATALCGELFGEYGDLPRERAGQHVYGSTPYPADKSILFHHESAHLARWPTRQWFFCVESAGQGGATPIVDGRRVFAALAPELRERFGRLGLLYVRNFTPGFDVSWQDFFQTHDRARVDERCRSEGMRCEWLDGGRLRITQRAPAVVRHPGTGDEVFFHQIQLHHPHSLEPAVRESLLALVGEAWLPRNVAFGDGTPIDASTVQVLADLYERCAVRFAWQPGDILLLDNMLVAHGRDPFAGKRKIVVAMGEMISQRTVLATAPRSSIDPEPR